MTGFYLPKQISNTDEGNFRPRKDGDKTSKEKFQ